MVCINNKRLAKSMHDEQVPDIGKVVLTTSLTITSSITITTSITVRIAIKIPAAINPAIITQGSVASLAMSLALSSAEAWASDPEPQGRTKHLINT